MRTCDFCGKQAADAEAATWMTSVENGRQQVAARRLSRKAEQAARQARLALARAM